MMGYAIRNGGQGWRSVNGPEDVQQDETYSDTAPAPTVDNLKTLAWDRIRAERDRRTENGGYAVNGVWFHSDQKSRSQQQDNEAEGSSLVAVEWKTMDGSFVTMTADLAVQIRAARMASDRAIFAVAETHRAAMESSADPSTYDYSGGWPTIFEEI